jgi:hypothetical protein
VVTVTENYQRQKVKGKCSMTVESFATVMRDPSLCLEAESEYVSQRTGKLGYRAILVAHKLWYWYSVSSTSTRVTPAEVAIAITSANCHVERCGPYKNGSGFEATVRSDGHWYMLGHGNNKPQIGDIE